MSKPAFLITIDTEGDYLWGAPRPMTTRNVHYLPRFQALCERYGLRPTWLTDYEMACDPCYQTFARTVLERDAGEVGMHLHAWNSPPLHHTLTDEDARHHTYLMEYPEGVMREKIGHLTHLLESLLGCKMLSHRAGRWGFDATYARLLVEQGYRVDCSVTPHLSWQQALGDPQGQGGSDYRNFPEQPYYMDLTAIHRAGDSPLLQVPVSIRKTPFFALRQQLQRLEEAMPAPIKKGRILRWPFRIAYRLLPEIHWLRPNGRNRNGMRAVLHAIQQAGEPCAEFMLHSSELMPGGSPTFATEAAIDRLYADLELLFASVADHFQGQTLAEFSATFRKRAEEPGSGHACGERMPRHADV
ncbi:MAG: deacetylase [Magnetococcales bacterium]|nr:deacetylase [Magnetococcales bacterium]